MQIVGNQYRADTAAESALLSTLLDSTLWQRSWSVFVKHDAIGKLVFECRGRFEPDTPIIDARFCGKYCVTYGVDTIYELPVSFTFHLCCNNSDVRIMWHSEDGRNGWIWEPVEPNRIELEQILRLEESVSNLHPV